VAPSAWGGLASLIRTHGLPADTTDRVRRSLHPLARFPRLGREIEGGRWAGFHFILGPWPWLIVVYRYDAAEDVVVVTLIEDGRAASSARSPGG
jgi:plasmid stabilization system protein ParE